MAVHPASVLRLAAMSVHEVRDRLESGRAFLTG
jgi:hypothetical protein